MTNVLVLLTISFLLSFVLPRSWHVAITTALSSVSFQPMSPAAPAGSVWAAGGFLKAGGNFIRVVFSAPGILLILLMTAQLVAVFWSPASPPYAVVIFSTFGIIACTAAFMANSRDLYATLRLIMASVSPILILQAAATILFLIDPSLEEQYLRSPLAELFMGDAASRLYTDLPNNVTDPFKSGGLFFVNGNRASMYLGVAAMLVFAVAVKYKRARYWVLGFFLIAGALFTFSKTAVILSVLTFAVALVSPAILSRGSSAGRFMFGIGLLGGLSIVALYVLATTDDFTEASETASASRLVLWKYAIRALADSPILGLGWGGWARYWAGPADSLRMSPGFPPHNFILETWTDSGLVAVIIIIALCLYAIVRLLLHIRYAGSLSNARPVAFVAAALIWMVMHGMYDNTSFYGSPNTLPFFSFVLAFVLNPIPSHLGVDTKVHRSRTPSSFFPGFLSWRDVPLEEDR
ncbi:O-antigen ligase family protein [Paramicrobacterium chengjingii]|uniref:O-antigen ligase family protein n=1 Tax=Paramicrobacterium chengjingii TaxID=2769067 RepID=A0ABX6YFC4_9MICO|nr:O-antigen ligase family protein [Microbacterium chengjingii]QPZ37479.1 O-antigen ligase family protein [Microbacterium chengjingii]